MKSNSPFTLGPGGKWLIFSGAFWAVLAVIFISSNGRFDWLEHLVGTAACLWIIWGTIAVIGVLALVMSDLIHERLAMWVGIVGWILTLSLGYWFYWHGPGKFGYH